MLAPDFSDSTERATARVARTSCVSYWCVSRVRDGNGKPAVRNERGLEVNSPARRDTPKTIWKFGDLEIWKWKKPEHSDLPGIYSREW